MARGGGLTILHVAYPLAPVRRDTAGGAEQVLLQLDAALVERGHRSLVLAMEGSAVSGELIATPAPAGRFDEAAKAAAQQRHALALRTVLRDRGVDLVHLHGVDFHCYLPPPDAAALVSLHLPLAFYPPEALTPFRPRTWLHCVSARQHAGRPTGVSFLPPIENGVAIPETFGTSCGDYALFLGRICPEKGVHLALDAAHRAGIDLVIAGEVFPYQSHLDYFARAVRPRLDGRRRYIGRVAPPERDRLLAGARCLLISSLAEETSSLVAREALAAGTPVIAFRSGALVDVVREGQDGFLVTSAEEMAAAIPRVAAIARTTCREGASTRFPLSAMLDAYISLYARLAATQAAVPA